MQADKKAGKHAFKQVSNGHPSRHTEKQTGISQTGRQAIRHPITQTDRQIGRQTIRETGIRAGK